MGKLGYKHTPEARAKISAAMTSEARAKIGAAQRGIKRSPETRAKISAATQGSKNGRWKGGRKADGSGYVCLLRPSHPFANCSGYIFEHRLVMEGILGRYLEPSELVHHKNQVKNDNRPENLEVVVHANHYGEVLCPLCQGHFLVR